MFPFSALTQRAKENNPIRVGIVGAGFLGAGIIRQVIQTPGMRLMVVSNRTTERAVAALTESGIEAAAIRVCQDQKQACKALEDGFYVVTPHSILPCEFKDVEVVVETTGEALFGTHAALKSIEAKKHFVASNAEVQATVGAILKHRADAAGVLYSDIDGDQPGILKKLYDSCVGLGFRPQVAGNCKGLLKRYATPETQADYAKANGIQPWIATAAADGTKLNMEMCLVANATGMKPDVSGMIGVQTSLENILNDFRQLGLLEGMPRVEFTLGIPMGVFVIAHREDPHVQAEMRYFKMGDGPHYVFFHPYVLCHYDAVPSIAGSILSREAVIAPLAGPPGTEVIAFAKRELASGQQIDGIGGYDSYGLLVDGEEAREKGYLPIGLCQYARLNDSVNQDEPIGLHQIEWTEDNELLALWHEQRQMQKEVISENLQR